MESSQLAICRVVALYSTVKEEYTHKMVRW